MPREKGPDKVQAKFYLAPGTKEVLRRHAQTEGIPMSQLIEELILGLEETAEGDSDG